MPCHIDTMLSPRWRALVPVRWSPSKIDELQHTAAGIASRDPVDPSVARILLACSKGDFDRAELDLLQLVRENSDRLTKSGEAFVSILSAAFVVQRLDLAQILLRSRFGFGRPFEIAVEPIGIGAACVRWDIQECGAHRFIFDSDIYSDDLTTHRMHQFQREFPLFAYYSEQATQETGQVILNQFDLGLRPGLAYSDNRPDFFLIPDCIFVPTRGYAHARAVLSKRWVPWASKKCVAFWRGSSTGPKSHASDWKSLDRVLLCELAKRNSQTGMIDAGITRVVQFSDPNVAREIGAAGLLKEGVPWQDWGEYKYHIQIDGNSSPWSNMFQALLTGGVVLKVESRRGLNQWFHSELKPWDNYVPIAPDLSDLMDKIKWLNRNDGFAEAVGRRGKQLVDRLTYENELSRSVPVISRAFAYFGGRPQEGTPFGWEALRPEIKSATRASSENRNHA
jgi:hypothetical protein